jgi:sialate O-acetylesterase
MALCVALALGLFGAGPCRGDITLPSLISDNMVFQQQTKINVWGKADPGESVTVQLGPESSQTTAGKDGSWSVKMGGLPSGGPYDLTVFGKNSITVRNVAIGEVWVCAGESNMEYKVMAARNGREEMADAELPMVRVFQVKHHASEKPEPDCEGAWAVCDPDTAKDFSAVGFFFARELNRRLHVPIAVIESAWGPSPAEAWTPRATLEKNPTLHVALDRYDKAASGYPAALAAYQARLADWQSQADTAKAAGSPAPPKPVAPLAPGGPRAPSALFNGMISPLLRYPIRGVLWYQGESNTSDPALYRTLFPAMIEAWRANWNEGDFPFFYAQLSGFLGRRPQPEESRWAELREAQSLALSTSRTGMAVTADTGDEHEMHPADKQDVAHRMALMAESEVYDRSGAAASGPVFSRMEVDDAKAVLSFTHTEGGLKAKNGQPLKGFEVAGENRLFVWADARIDGDQVIVQSKQVAIPVAVRYGWADFPDCTLFNRAGLPASPFRTDTWVAGEASPPPEASPSPTPGRHRKHHVTPET